MLEIETPQLLTETNKLNPNQQIIVNGLIESGYQQEFPENKDSSSELHFKRYLHERRFYPHFHLIFDLEVDKWDLHTDIRRHKTLRHSGQLSEEKERLYYSFGLLSYQAATDNEKRLLEKTSKKISCVGTI